MRNVGVFLFDDIELLDFAGPYEVFSVTAELHDNGLFKVFTVTEDGEPILTVNGLKVAPDYGFAGHPPIDVLVVPGGVGTKAAMAKEPVLKWLREQYERCEVTMSVCSGARLLGALGLLDGREYITHHEVIADMAGIAPRATVRAGARFVDEDRIMTSAGISAGIDLSLHVVAKLYGREAAAKTAVYMEYGDWEKLL